jgi:hypothetical protein
MRDQFRKRSRCDPGREHFAFVAGHLGDEATEGALWRQSRGRLNAHALGASHPVTR